MVHVHFNIIKLGMHCTVTLTIGLDGRSHIVLQPTTNKLWNMAIITMILKLELGGQGHILFHMVDM